MPFGYSILWFINREIGPSRISTTHAYSRWIGGLNLETARSQSICLLLCGTRRDVESVAPSSAAAKRKIARFRAASSPGLERDEFPLAGTGGSGSSLPLLLVRLESRNAGCTARRTLAAGFRAVKIGPRNIRRFQSFINFNHKS